MAKHNDIGQQAEDQALDFLRTQGMALLKRNYRCKPGEIDLILLDNTTLVFTEVRYRSHTGYGSPSESVTRQKQKKLIAAAQIFLQQNPRLTEHPARFDVIGISANKPIDWIKNAFDEI